MPTKQVTIQGIMTWEESPGGGGTGIWGPTDPRPTPPIYIPQPPLGIWGPTDPRPGYGLPGQPPGTWGGGNVPMPTPPIHLGPGAGGGTGIWGPTDPRPGYGLPGGGAAGGGVMPPAAGVPVHGSMVFVPGYGYVFVPDGAAPPTEETPPTDGEA